MLKLFIGDGDKPHLIFGGQAPAHSGDMRLGIFRAGAVALVNRILHHGKAAFQ